MLHVQLRLVGPITAYGGQTYVTSQTGTGTTFVMQASPTLTTPNIGAATGTTVTLTGGRSEFRANSEAFAIGVKYVSTGGVIYLGATDGTGSPGWQISAGTGASLLTGDSSGNATAAGTVTGTRLISTVAIGTAPLAVTSTTRISNLNAATCGNADTVTTNANLTGPITSSGNATSIASQTGTGTKFVVDTSPTLVTPNIGAATGTTVTLTGGRSEFRPNSEVYAVGVRYNSGAGVFYIGASNSAAPDMIFSEGGGAERLRITNDGRLYGTALHNNSGSLTGTTNQYVASGTYTATCTNTVNAATSSCKIKWARIGNCVVCKFDLTTTPPAGGAVQVDVTLPIASALASGSDLGGSGAINATPPATVVGVQGLVAGGKAAIQFNATGLGGISFNAYGTFMYEVL